MKQNKRGGLDLSIQTVVIVVLSLTLLGLGIAFIRNMFDDVTVTQERINDQIRDQILQDLAVGNQKMLFPHLDLSLAPNKIAYLQVGIKNMEDKSNEFKVSIKRSISSEQFTDIVSSQSPQDAESDAIFFWDATTQVIGAGESRVVPIFHEAESKKGTYLYKLEVLYGGQDGKIDGVGDGTYDAKTFFVTVS